MDFKNLKIDLIFGEAFHYFRTKIKKEMSSKVANYFGVSNSYIRLVENGHSKFSDRHLLKVAIFLECDIARTSLIFSLMNIEDEDGETLLSTEYYSGLKEILEEEYSEENKDERSAKVIAWLQGDISKESSSKMSKALRFYNSAEALFKESN